MHKIHIKNFGPIKDLKMDIKDYLVLIGQQATGKSTVSKLIYFFRTIKDEMYRYFREEIENSPVQVNFTYLNNGLLSVIRHKFLRIYGSTYSMKGLSVKYEYDEDKSISLSSSSTKTPLNIDMTDALTNSYKQPFYSCSNNIRSINEAITGLSSDVDINIISERKERCFRELKGNLNNLFKDDTSAIYIPAGRAMATVFADQMSKENIEYKDLLTGNFIERIRNYRIFYLKDMEQNTERTSCHSYASKYIKTILKGDYVYEKVRDRETYEERLYINRNKFVKMQFASSGQQECLWILLTLNKILYDDQYNKQKVLFIVEEPEAHLYPIAQRDLVELISYVMNATQGQMIITTHSPYILTSFNNLIHANNVAKKISIENEVTKIVDKSLWIDIDKMDVYELEGGECIDIVDRELNFIKAEAIDKASDDIEDVYEKLFDIK
ncbi:AAA family ATPase [Candidatus Magnetominusculus xianensis]|uniref:Endonuclease GajA/Old nuclease/RecF-like AAA domain-containing protein n=1 Tax=Candidatus Magnetominusculus xianensis TaxID=1748249 RepID=A0ABR5SHC2_9BACT|nr:AAA family ATPase [Candidatus Magnetominusculus xianensis]KWT91070.1 hypothetical protein ASN18_0894 [Candidatus Magnetominusculus xianensis]MBF0403285.1 AAA family ATPase [Nitrospirota bacterium]